MRSYPHPTDPNVECQPYLYPPVASSLASFPGIWSGATIVEGDNNALAKWASIQPNVPDIPPKVDSLLFQHLSLAFSDAVIYLGHPSRKFRRPELWIRRPGLLVDEHKVHEAQGFWNPRGYLDSPRGESSFTPKITRTELKATAG
jgi:hypothetical protein